MLEIDWLAEKIASYKKNKVLSTIYNSFYCIFFILLVSLIDIIYLKKNTILYLLYIIWKSNLTDKMKRSFFQAAVVSILLYGCTSWTLTKRPEKNLDGNYTRMLRAILNESRRQHPTKQQLYGHLPPITKTIQVRRTRHAGHYLRTRDELISDVLLWTPSHVRAKAGRTARTYLQQLCEDMGCSPGSLPEAMNDREGWRERVRVICADGTTTWDDDFISGDRILLKFWKHVLWAYNRIKVVIPLPACIKRADSIPCRG